MNNSFIFDTYAILEIIGGNDKYKGYLESNIIINNFIFAELCYKLLRENIKNAEDYIRKYSQFVYEVDQETIKEAMEFRIKNKKRNLSMTDCISYIMSKKLNIKFLTGDKEFESLDNVEYIK
ncbi:PIN domain-containing protein [Candidatus Woesearchaeota archaeon]|nr:PIN domain-containing protein [Candidatus Woesearchaeota archaeon]